MTTQTHPKQPHKQRLTTAALVVSLVFTGSGCGEENRPPDPFVGMYNKSENVESTTDLMLGFLWIEEPCAYLRIPAPIPLDIQSVADLNLDLEKAAASIANRSPAPDWSPLSVWVPADVQIVSKSKPEHRILLRLHRDSTRYDPATGQLWIGKRGPYKRGPYSSGDFVTSDTGVEDLSEEYRSMGCDALGQIKTSFLDSSEVSRWYGMWR